MSVFVLDAIAQDNANKGQTAIEEGQRIRITLLAEYDAIRKDTLNGPGVFDYTIGAKPENGTYKEIPISSGESLEITTFPPVEGGTSFYYRFVPCESLKVPEGSTCEIILNDTVQRSLEIIAEGIRGPVTIFYIVAGEEDIDQFTPLPNYDLKRAAPNQTLEISCRIDRKRIHVGLGIAAMQYPKQPPPSPADANNRESTPPGGQASNIEQNAEAANLPPGYRNLVSPARAEDIASDKLSVTPKRVDWLGGEGGAKQRIVTWHKVGFKEGRPQSLRFRASKGSVEIEISGPPGHVDRVEIAALRGNRDLWKTARLKAHPSGSEAVKTITFDIPTRHHGYYDYEYYLLLWNTERNKPGVVTVKTSHTLQSEQRLVGRTLINFQRHVVEGESLKDQRIDFRPYKIYKIKIPELGTLAVELHGPNRRQLRAQLRGDGPTIEPQPVLERSPFEIHTPGTYLLKIDNENGVSTQDRAKQKFNLALSFEARVELWDVENAEPLVSPEESIDPPDSVGRDASIPNAESLSIKDGNTCEILLQKEGQGFAVLIAEFQGPATIFYISLSQEGIDQFAQLPNYDLKKAGRNETIKIYYRVGAQLGELPNIAAVQYPRN